MPARSYFCATRSGTDIVAIIDPGHAAKQLIFERIFRSATLIAAILVLLILGGVAVSLLRGAWPALSHFRLAFVTREIWNPVTDQFGALAPIYGTVVTSAIAMLIAVPTGFGIALLLNSWRRCPASFLEFGACSCLRPYFSGMCSPG